MTKNSNHSFSRPSFLALGFSFFLGLSLLNPLPAATRDPKAEAIVQASVEAMGGRKAYDETRYLCWNFFGRRFHVWDKWTGRIRIETSEGLLVLMNVNDRSGRAWLKGEAITDPAALQEKMTWGYETWINDSYWLVMPYKLEDQGVNLHYLRTDEDLAGNRCDILEMTFEKVGVTPENRYLIYVNQKTHLVCQWDWFENASDVEPKFRLPWANWTKTGKILLSGERGTRKLSVIAAPNVLADSVFEATTATGLQTGFAK